MAKKWAQNEKNGGPWRSWIWLEISICTSRGGAGGVMRLSSTCTDITCVLFQVILQLLKTTISSLGSNGVNLDINQWNWRLIEIRSDDGNPDLRSSIQMCSSCAIEIVCQVIQPHSAHIRTVGGKSWIGLSPPNLVSSRVSRSFYQLHSVPEFYFNRLKDTCRWTLVMHCGAAARFLYSEGEEPVSTHQTYICNILEVKSQALKRCFAAALAWRKKMRHNIPKGGRKRNPDFSLVLKQSLEECAAMS